MFDKNSEASFVLNRVFEFIKVWQSGDKSKLTLQSKNGKAWINFNCCLGGPLDQHEKFVPKPKSKSKKRKERDNLRAQLYQQKLQEKNSSSKSSDGSLNLQLSSLSSHNESEMEVASSPSIHKIASSSPKNDNSILETRTESNNSDPNASDPLEKDVLASTVINEHNPKPNPKTTDDDSSPKEKQHSRLTQADFDKIYKALFR